MWSRKQDAGTTTETQEEEQPSRWSSHSARSELTVGTNEVLWVLELDALDVMLMCGGTWPWVQSRQFLLFCV